MVGGADYRDPSREDITAGFLRAESALADEDPQRTLGIFAELRATGNSRLRDLLVERHTSLVHFLARKFKDRGESLEDVIQQGMIGLINAIDRFDLRRGVKFTTYATPMIAGEIKRYFRDKGRRMKVPRRLQELQYRVGGVVEELTQRLQRSPTIREISEALGATEETVVEALEMAHSMDLVSLDSDLPAHEDESPASFRDRVGCEDDALEVLGVRSHLEESLKVLNVRERAVVTMHFFDGLSQSDIAKRMGISQMQVSRLKQNAVDRLRRFFRGAET